jgi:hypothetical protein
MSEEKTKTEFDSTMEALRRAESVLPDFTSSYDSQIRRLYDEIVNRPAFRYDPAGDPLYQSYRTQMVGEGQRAMRDTMGQAAALTGGYGSSYAQSVGQQEYEYYLQRLGQVMPQLYRAAWERYSAEGDELRGLFDSTMALAKDEVSRGKDRYDMAAKLEEQAYQREQDRLDRELAREQLQYQRQQAGYSQMLAQEKLNYERGEKSYQNMMKLITQSGYMPSDAELSAAGMSRGQADALRSSYLMKNPMAMLMSGGLPAGLSALAGGYTGGGYTSGKGGYTSSRSAGTGTPGSKEQMKLDANKKGSGSNGKSRRL